MAKRFSASIDDFVTKSQERIDAVVRESTQRVIDGAQTPVSKGGRMRVDTGFLRASGQLSLNGMPSGPTRPQTQGPFAPVDTSLGLAGVSAGDIIYFGWSANYAKYREAYDGFLGAEVQNWSSTVAKVVEELKRRIG